jgi:hypothetical protein
MMLKQCLCAGAVCGGRGFMAFKVRSVDGDETGVRDWFGGLLLVRAMRHLCGLLILVRGACRRFHWSPDGAGPHGDYCRMAWTAL